MNGFSQDLQETTLTSKLYRKVSFDNLTNYGELCCSTSNSSELSSHGELCLVFAEKQYTGYYVDGDADAGKNFGYDEFRVELDPDDADWLVYPDSLEDDEDFNFDVFIDLGFVAISETNYKQRFNDNINFNF